MHETITSAKITFLRTPKIFYHSSVIQLFYHPIPKQPLNLHTITLICIFITLQK